MQNEINVHHTHGHLKHNFWCQNQSTTSRILSIGIGTTSRSYTQSEVLDKFEIENKKIRSIYLNGGIYRRNLDLTDDCKPGNETQAQLLRKHTRQGIKMGCQAIVSCLEKTPFKLENIDYLCCVTSTGFLTPGFSAHLIKELRLKTSCARLDVVGMGCNAGLNALNSVSSWSAQNPGKLGIVVCIEVCSAAYVLDEHMETAVVNGLFGDGASAIALYCDDTPFTGSQTGRPQRHPLTPCILKFSSLLMPDAIDAMRFDWSERHGKFSFHLDTNIPYVIGSNARIALEQLLRGTGLDASQIDHWILHSGGKKVIDSIRINLHLSQYDVRHTLSVLRDHGNVSSGSFLFSYERLSNEGVCRTGDLGVMMTMGPGATIEMALLRWS